MFDIYSGILKMTETFRDDNQDVVIKYLCDADYKELNETYKLSSIAGNKSDLDKSLNLLNWISSNIYHNGNNGNQITSTAMELLKYAFDKGETHGINCRSLSITLTECLFAVGVKARVMYIMPFSPYDMDNHVVCEVWIKELNKWVMIDPTYNLYATFDNNILNLMEMRKLLANQEEIIFNDKANYNGEPINKKELMAYYAKDLFRIMFTQYQGLNSSNISEGKMINITPIGYDVKNYDLANIEYCMKKSDSPKNSQKRLDKIKKEQTIYKSPNILY